MNKNFYNDRLYLHDQIIETKKIVRKVNSNCWFLLFAGAVAGYFIGTQINDLDKRIKKLEEAHEALHQLATSVAVMAEKMDTMTRSMDTLTNKVELLEAEPAKKWRFVVEKALYFVVAAVIGFALAQLGL